MAQDWLDPHLRIVTFSDFKEHTLPLFRELKILRLTDLGFFHNALFMYDYYTSKLPPAFDEFFKKTNKVHKYNTRLASKESFYLPSARTNYGKFCIRFQGVKIWNAVNENYKSLRKHAFKQNIKADIINGYF